MIAKTCEDAIVEWIRFFRDDIKSIDDFRNSDALSELSYQIFGENYQYDGNMLSREQFDKLCSELSSRANIEILHERSEHIGSDELIRYCKVLYFYAGSCNAQIYIAPILQLPEFQQSVLRQIFEELSNESNTKQSPVINDIESLEEDNKKMREQLALLKSELSQSQHQRQEVEKKFELRMLQEGSRNDALVEQLKDLQAEINESKQALKAFESVKREYEDQREELRLLREENDTLNYQQEQGAKQLAQLEHYKQAAKDLQERCKDVDQLEKEISRLRATEAENVQIRLELHDTQGKLDAMKRANEVLANKLTEAVSENEVLRAANKKSEVEAGRLHQQLKENSAETNGASLKRAHPDSDLLTPLLETDPHLQSQLKRLQEERDRLAERISQMEQDSEQQKRDADAIVISQQLETLEKNYRELVREKSELEQKREILEEQLKEYMTENSLLSEELGREKETRLNCESDLTRKKNEISHLQEINKQLGDSLTELRDEVKAKEEEKERVINEKEKELSQFQSQWEEKQEQLQRQTEQQITSITEQMDQVQKDLEEKQQLLLERENLIQRGKEQLRKLQHTVEEATASAAAARKEMETLSTKNGQLTREIFLLRHEKSKKQDVTAITQNEEYVVLLKENEELLRRLKAYESGQHELTTRISMEDDKGHVARTLNNRLKALENENSGLGMVKSQLLQNKHILEQQLNEIMEECKRAKETNTSLELQLRRIQQLARDKQYKELKAAIASISFYLSLFNKQIKLY